MKPFDLQKALAGEPVVDGNGEPAIQLTLFNVKEGPFVRPLAGVWKGRIRTWLRTGQYMHNRTSKNDLFMASKTKSLWVLLHRYRNGSGAIFCTKFLTEKEALSWQDSIAPSTVEILCQPTRIDYED